MKKVIIEVLKYIPHVDLLKQDYEVSTIDALAERLIDDIDNFVLDWRNYIKELPDNLYEEFFNELPKNVQKLLSNDLKEYNEYFK